jgi:A/G-specific adenine glycosylase
MLGGLWVFPGGKQKPGESLADTVYREVAQATGLQIRVDYPYCQVQHAYTHLKVTLTAFRCTWISGDALPLNSDGLCWVRWNELDAYPLPKVNLKVLAAVREHEKYLPDRAVAP